MKTTVAPRPLPVMVSCLRPRALRLLFPAALALVLLLLPAAPLPAADANGGTGVITGRVINVATGGYLNNARVTVAGTDLVAFTNEFGEYRLAGVPAGSATLRVFYTGLDDQSTQVQVSPDAPVRQDFRLTSSGRYGDQDLVAMDPFVISADRETNAAAIASNEQRFAANIKNVVSSDAFGDVTEGNVGEFIKYLPGVTVDYVAADVRTISVRGFADNFTSVNVDGNRMASAASGSTIRTFELEQVSINNVSRIEVTKEPTPDMAADSLGGAVNLVSRSAFEQAEPSLRYKAYLSLNSEDTSVFGKTPGPGEKETHKVLPGFELNYVNPVSDRFGYVVNALSSNQFNEQHRSQTEWRFAGAGASATAPYLRRYTLQDGPKNTFRDSISLKGDWKLTEQQRLSASFQVNYYKAFFGNRNLNFDVGSNNAPSPSSGTPLDFGPTFTHGATGRGSVTQGGSWRDKLGATQAAALNWSYDAHDWELDAGFNASRSKSWYRAVGRDHFSGYSLNMQGESRVFYDDIDGHRPPAITVLDAAGGMLDPYDLASFRVNYVESQPVDARDTFMGVHFDAERHFAGATPFSLKAGVALRRQLRDIANSRSRWTFVGADGEANTDDDNAAQFVDPKYSGEDPYWGFPQVQWPNPYAMYDLFVAHPEYFELQENYSETQRVNSSKRLLEWVSSAYLMGQARLADNRLNVVAGVRLEQTEDFGQGPLNLGATSSLPLAELQDVLIERAYSAGKKYSDLYPSVHLTYNFTDNLLGRFAYAKTLGRPDFGNIIPVVTINDDENTGLGTISSTNPDLKPWEAQNFDASLEYYFSDGGVVSVGAFSKSVKNFFGTVNRVATAEDLAEVGLPADYVGWDITRPINAGKARISGLEFNYNQPLTRLGEWGRHFNVTANGTWLRLRGENEADFRRFIPRSGNIGIRANFRPVVLMLKWNIRGRQKNGTASSGTYGPGAFEYYKPRTFFDVNVEVQLSKRFVLFANGRNILNVPQTLQRYADAAPDYARTYRTEKFGVQFAVGVKGAF